MATSIYQKRLLEKRKANGLCIDCGTELDRDGVRCIKCNTKHNEESKADRKWYIENGICPRCMKNTLFGDENMCPECSAEMYEINMNSRERLGREHYNEVHKEWSKRTHHEMIERGICTRCRKRKADYGYKTCGICRGKIRNYKRMKYGKQDRSERYKQGLCYFCDNPIKDGYKVCEKHYQMNVEKSLSQKAKEARRELKDSGILY